MRKNTSICDIEAAAMLISLGFIVNQTHKQKRHPRVPFLSSVLAYLSKDKTLCADWFAWANMAVAAWATICERAIAVVSVA